MRSRREPAVPVEDVPPLPDDPDAPGTVAETVLATLYDEIAQSLDRQHDHVDRLNERAQQLFGFAAVILTIIAAVAPGDASTATKVAFLVAIPLFGFAAWYAAGAWRLASWRGDPDVQALWERRRRDGEEHFRYQVILNRLESIRENDKRIAAKVKTVKRSQVWLYGGFVYISGLVAFRLLF